MTERELDHASTVSLHPTLEVRAFPRKVTVPTDDLRRALQAERRPPMSTGR